MEVQIKVKGTVIDCATAVQLCALYDEETIRNLDVMHPYIFEGGETWVDWLMHHIEGVRLDKYAALPFAGKLRQLATVLEGA